jgi:hypothetical protein
LPIKLAIMWSLYLAWFSTVGPQWSFIK